LSYPDFAGVAGQEKFKQIAICDNLSRHTLLASDTANLTTVIATGSGLVEFGAPTIVIGF